MVTAFVNGGWKNACGFLRTSRSTAPHAKTYLKNLQYLDTEDIQIPPRQTHPHATNQQLDENLFSGICLSITCIRNELAALNRESTMKPISKSYVNPNR